MSEPNQKPDETKDTPQEGDSNEESSLLAEVPLATALNGPNADDWYEAIAAEIKSVVKNDTWILVDRPVNKRVIGSRIVLRNKYKADATLDRRKARLVAQGFAQQPGVHFNQTFAPVARASSIRTLVSIATERNMKIYQLDVTTAYLNGELEEMIHMEPPKLLTEALNRIITSKNCERDLIDKCNKMIQELQIGNKVCRLKKSLYGLKQAGRSWHERLDKVLQEYGAVPTKSDACVYLIERGEDIAFLTVFVDDILVITRKPQTFSNLVKHLRRSFEIKDLGEASHCLGIEFQRKDGKIILSQKSYILDILERFGMSDCKQVGTPMLPRPDLLPEKNPTDEDSKLPYRELIGALSYLAISTRPDISFEVSYLSQFNNCFSHAHWTAAKRVLRYLRGTTELGLSYGPDSRNLEGHVDADWGSCPVDRRSYTGYVFMLNNGPVSWEARKQRTVALSSTEAEYMGMSEATKEAIHLRSLLEELDAGVRGPVTLYNDNRGALHLAQNPTFHGRSKHIDIRCHFIRGAIKERLIEPKHMPTEEMIADFLTKGLAKSSHTRCVDSLSTNLEDEVPRDTCVEGKY